MIGSSLLCYFHFLLSLISLSLSLSTAKASFPAASSQEGARAERAHQLVELGGVLDGVLLPFSMSVLCIRTLSPSPA